MTNVERCLRADGWTETPEAARAALVELNHRHALDGRDPSSYGGLYWCLGLFDRPFSPERAVVGTVRARPTSSHAARLDVSAYARRTERPTRRIGSVAVVGAGLAGLACARTLARHNVNVVVFDKGRAPGGRLATRRVGECVFDLGAQYFTASDPRFARVVESWQHAGVVARWEGRIRAVDVAGGEIVEPPPVHRFVGTPRMSSLARHLAEDLEVRSSHRVDHIEMRDGRWSLVGVAAPSGVTLAPRGVVRGDAPAPSPDDLGDFDALALCVPPAQAQALIGPEWLAPALDVPFDPCIAIGFHTDALEDAAFDGLFVGRDGDAGRVIAWVARDSKKPARRGGGEVVVHAAPEWSARHFEDSDELVQTTLLGALARTLGVRAIRTTTRTVQRWRLARPRSTLGGVWFDDERRIGAAGDWTGDGRVEGAFLSGVALAGRLLGLGEDT